MPREERCRMCEQKHRMDKACPALEEERRRTELSLYLRSKERERGMDDQEVHGWSGL